MWISILGILLLLVSMLVYVFIRIKNFSLIKKINNKLISRFIIIIIILLFLLFIYIDMVNTIVVFIHLFIFLLLLDFIFMLINKISKKSISYSISLILSIIITTCYLGYGYFLAHHVVETRYVVESNKDIGVDNFRIAQITDSHIGATMNGDEFIKYMDRINKTNPDLVVVTGDFVDDDTSKEDMIKGCIGLGNLKSKYGVYFIYGNHDKGYFNYRNYTYEDLEKELEKNGVIVLEDEIVNISENIVLIGRKDAQTLNRLSAQELTKDLDKSKYIITLDHEPNDYKNETDSEMDLILLGHTHGGQLFPLGQIGVMLGINDSFYGLEKHNNSTFIINSGIGDWAIKFKTGTKAEYTIIDIKNKTIYK